MKFCFTFAIIVTLLLGVCCQNKQNRCSENGIQQNQTDVLPEKIKKSFTNKEGRQLNIIFNNSKNTATVCFQGKQIELTRKITASGICYQNNHYQLQGKGNNISLKRDGHVLFEHHAKNEK